MGIDAHRPDAPFDAGPPPPPGCSLPSAAFCDDFESTGAPGPRSAELDGARWSVGRVLPQLPTSPEGAFWIGPSMAIEGCRGDRDGTELGVADDTIRCDPQPAITTHHMLTSVAAQNYGLNSYRPRKPFDFTGRTGTIALDVDLTNVGNGGLGFVSLAITDTPVPTPSFSRNEKANGPINGIELVFNRGDCDGHMTGLWGINVFRDQVERFIEMTSSCIDTEPDHLNHVEVRVSRDRIEVLASDPSPDGRTFENLRSIQTVALDLPFERGWVNFTAHNHATLKYGGVASYVVRWDNFAFDGPSLTHVREHSGTDLLDAVVREASGCMVDGVCRSLVEGQGCDSLQCTMYLAGNYIGYVLNEGADTSRIDFENVDPSGVERALLAFTSWYPSGDPAYVLRYRWNGGTWRQRPLTADEVRLRTGGPSDTQEGSLNQTIEVDLTDLLSGTNTLEVGSSGIPSNFPAAVANLDLLLFTGP